MPTPAAALHLMVITDPLLLKGRDVVEACRRAVRGGATVVQVRWKDGTPAEVAALTRALVAALPAPVIVNDRVDVALAAGAAGAHLGHDDVPLAALRPHVPSGFWLGISVGSPEEAEGALAMAADYWSVGPCFATGTKTDAGPALGPEGFARLAGRAPAGTPVIGIGGVDASGAAALARAGATGVAVIGAVWVAPDPEAAARGLRHAVAPEPG